MSSLKAFMKQNVLKVENKFVPISDRMIDDKTREPIGWEIRAIMESENAKIKEGCWEKDNSKTARKTGQTSKFNGQKYIQKLCSASVVFPDLKDSSLQASYGVIGEEELLVAMLTAEEYSKLQDEIDDFSGQITRQKEGDKDEVKNS